jgi:hypothetical protein
MLHEYLVTRSVRYYLRLHVTAVGLGTYYAWIRGHYSSRRKTFHCATLSTTNLIRTDLGLNPGLRGNMPTTNSLSLVTAHFLNNLIINKFPVCTFQGTPCALIRNVMSLLVYSKSSCLA